MVRHVSIVFVSTLFILFVACSSRKNNTQTNTNSEAIPIVFPEELFGIGCHFTEEVKAKNRKLIYYFDGDCALCFGRLRALEALSKNEFNNIPLIFVASTHNLSVFSLNLEKSKIESCVLVDTSDVFYKPNEDHFYINQIGLLDEQNHLLLVGDLLSDEDVKKAYKKMIAP